MRKIVAAAIKDKEGKVHTLPPPARHHTIIRDMAINGIRCSSHLDDQGFVDDEGNFLDRAEARTLVVENGQCLSPDHPRHLFSEDLW